MLDGKLRFLHCVLSSWC
uniref:Uncharacterized protein n=1 Tax=Arundo donax TaxID=35708 RepID=A0A0A8Y190_ARUDO